MKESKIIVHTRKEFAEKFRELFIKTSDESDRKFFNFGYAIKHWTAFWLFIDGVFITVELIEK